MATNNPAFQGLLFSRNRRNASPTYQGNKYTIKAGYATKIAIGDVVAKGTGGNAGYVTLAADNPAAQGILGVFGGVLGYFDNTAQQQVYGLNGAWPGANANASTDVTCLVFDDPDDVFRAQVLGGPALQSWIGSNINWVAGTNGVPAASGISTLQLSAASIAVPGTTLPFRIQELVGVSGGPQDPANVNPWIEVCINFGMSVYQAGAGV